MGFPVSSRTDSHAGRFIHRLLRRAAAVRPPGCRRETASSAGPGKPPDDLPGDLPDDLSEDLADDPPDDLPDDLPDHQPEDLRGDPPKDAPDDQPEDLRGDPPEDAPDHQPDDLRGDPPEDAPCHQPEDLRGDPPDDLPARLAWRLARRSPRLLDRKLRSAAVLVPLLPGEGGYRLLLTRRSPALRRQPGRLAFPGGMMEPGDGTERRAALRESQEEIGRDPREVGVLGCLDDRLTVEGFRLSPFLGLVRPGAALRANAEVAEIFEIPLAVLPGCESTEIRTTASGERRVIFHYRYGRRDVWGLTARVIRDLLDLI